MKGNNFHKIDQIQTKRISTNLKDIAGMFARPVGGSGADWRAKGDIISDMFLIECKDKATKSKQRTVYREVFDKIKMEALHENKIPLYAFGFGDGDDFFILDGASFYDIVDRLVSAEKKVKSLEATQ